MVFYNHFLYKFCLKFSLSFFLPLECKFTSRPLFLALATRAVSLASKGCESRFQSSSLQVKDYFFKILSEVLIYNDLSTLPFFLFIFPLKLVSCVIQTSGEDGVSVK